MFSAVPHVCYYVGLSQNIQSRLKFHWSNGTPADLSGKLIEAGVAQHTGQATRWITDHVLVRWLESDEIPMGDAYLEHFLIAALKPEFNKP